MSEQNLLVCAFGYSMNVYDIKKNNKLIHSFNEAPYPISNLKIMKNLEFDQLITIHENGLITYYNI